MRVLIANVHVPFIQGGAELQAESLKEAFCKAGHQAEIAKIPFNDYPQRMAEQLKAFENLDLRGSVGMPIDMLVCMKFPTYLIPHPHKILWLPHQYRQAYDLWKNPYGGLDQFPAGEQIRTLVMATDKRFIPQAKAIFTTSQNNTRRLKDFCGINSLPLYHPPRHAEKFYCTTAEDYFFMPSRITPLKRHDLVLKALRLTRNPVVIYFAGAPDSAGCEKNFVEMLSGTEMVKKAKWFKFVSEEEKFKLYAQSLGVIFAPYDEDYGYITLEAMLSSKAVISCSDSGGPLEFIRHGETGLVADPTPESLARMFDLLWEDRMQARLMGERGRQRYAQMDISWERVIQSMLLSVQQQ